MKKKNTQSSALSSLSLSLFLFHTHTNTHKHTQTHKAGAPSTRKETESGTKDHPLCLRTVNGRGNVFNLSPESNNGAHSTPPRYCSTVGLKALGFYHPSLSQFLCLFPLCVLFMKGLICGLRRQALVEEKENCGGKRKRINGWKDEVQMNESVFDSGCVFSNYGPRIWMTPAGRWFIHLHSLRIQFHSSDRVSGASVQHLLQWRGKQRVEWFIPSNVIQVIVSTQLSTL